MTPEEHYAKAEADLDGISRHIEAATQDHYAGEYVSERYELFKAQILAQTAIAHSNLARYVRCTDCDDKPVTEKVAEVNAFIREELAP